MTFFGVRIHRAIKWRVAIWLVPLCCAPQAISLPLVAGNFNIAQQFLHGDAHVVVLGDSEQNVLMGTYPTHWHIDRWTGQANLNEANGGNSGAYGTTINQAFVGSAGYYLPTETPPDGIKGISQGVIPHILFNGTAAGPEANILTNRVFEAGLVAGQDSLYYGGKWADKSTGSLTYSILTYANPNGVATGRVSFDVRINSTDTPVASLPINTLSGTAGFQTQSATFAAEAWAPGNRLAGAFRVLPGQAPTDGSNLIVAGTRITTGEPGFQLADLHYGGVGIDYFLDPANCSDAALAAYLGFTDSNIAYIWLGQNNAGSDDGPAFKAKMQQLIARYKAAKPGMQFVLVSTYDTGNPRLADYAQGLYDISQADSSVLFLNLYQSAGDFAFLDANYLADHVHENAAGNPYFADQTNALLEMAAANVPEPSGAMLLICGSVATAISRRRRR